MRHAGREAIVAHMTVIPTAAAGLGHSPSRLARDVVVIGASAGGIEALKHVVGQLPADYSGAVFVVLHIPSTAPSVLPRILGRVTRLVCVSAYDRAPIRPGMVYVAPPDEHLVLEQGEVRLVRGPRENNHRPAVDPLFRSAARAYGPRVAGVVLSGNLDDGTRGLIEIKAHGGVAVVQNPEDALFPGMPTSAIEHVRVDHVLPCREVGRLLVTLAGERDREAALARFPEPADFAEISVMHDGTEGRPSDLTGDEGPEVGGQNGANGEQAAEHLAGLDTGVGVVDGGARINERLGGVLSGYTCPECRGSLWEMREGELVRYRCRVGHAYTESGLVEHKGRAVEDALWTALTALEESASIAARVADRATEGGRDRSAAQFRERAEMLERRGAVLRDVLRELPGHEPPSDAAA